MCKSKEHTMPISASNKNNFTIIDSQILKNEYSDISEKIENKLNSNATNPLKII